MLDALVVSNGIQGLKQAFRSDGTVRYRFADVRHGFDPDLEGCDLLVVPNGSDHVAMLRIAGNVRSFLDAGRALFCFDGWFTSWVPGNQWVMDNTKATKDVLYRVRTDRHALMQGVDVNTLIFTHGISGWWACGFIEQAPGADVVLEDTWHRPVVVLDESTTPGTMFLTASGPLPGFGDGPEDDLSRLLRNALRHVERRKETRS